MNKPLHILVVEDSETAQLVAKQHLTDLDCLVDLASNCEIAIDMCNRTHYNAVLMDLGLYPGPDGFEVAKLIKTESVLNKDTPIIALSIHSEAQFYQQCQETGITGFISKPFTPYEATELVKLIKKGFSPSLN